jgi:hypothetical protein
MEELIQKICDTKASSYASFDVALKELTARVSKDVGGCLKISYSNGDIFVMGKPDMLNHLRQMTYLDKSLKVEGGRLKDTFI